MGLLPVQVPPWHVSVCVQPFPSLQDVPFGAERSGGQVAAFPGQFSARSQAPVDARQTAVAGRKPSAGQLADVPPQVSATSQMPAEARHTVPDGRN